MASTHLTTLPAEILGGVLFFLDADDLEAVSLTCRMLREIAIGDDVWRRIVQGCLDKSPPVRSPNITRMNNPPPPWDPSFGLVSTDRNPATRERWFAAPPGAEVEEEAKAASQSDRYSLSLDLFPGAESYYEVYNKFIRHMHKLLGWWSGNLPSYGMTIRIVFDTHHPSESNSRDAAAAAADIDPAFVCEKVHLVNRLQGMGSTGLRSPWMEATSFDMNALQGRLSSDGVTVETDRVSVDVTVPGIKTETLWVTSWSDALSIGSTQMKHGTDAAKIAWSGSQNSVKVGSSVDRAVLDRHGEPSIVSRARALAEHMVFGTTSQDRSGRDTGDQEMTMDLDVDDGDDDNDDDDDDDGDDGDDELPDVGPGAFGQGLTISQIVAASAVDTFENGDFDHIPHQLRTIQQRSGQQIHTVFLSSGAILTSPVREKGAGWEKKEDRLSLRFEKYQPYEGARYDKSRAFALYTANYIALPPIDFPPPALLPLVRDVDHDFTAPSHSPAASSSPAYERFLDQQDEVSLNVLRMEPCPPYRPWPHLSQPQPSGLRFVPIQPPARQPVTSQPTRSGKGEIARYEHAVQIPPELDPGCAQFDWDSLQGLYSMSYGPWGLELIYIRSRILTEHDFEPIGGIIPNGLTLQRPTGPHGPGHEIDPDTNKLIDIMHWRPEPYIDLRDLQSPKDDLAFIRPGCRVIEGVKCTGDANVPRGTVSFRAFSRGQAADDCVSYVPPGSQWANHSPWDGADAEFHSSLHQRRRHHSRPGHHRQSNQKRSPGRILDCATGRLAIEGFVNAGTWKSCSVKISSADEISVYWEALRKVAVAKRLTSC